MLERRYDPTLPYQYVNYGRMSNDKQNKRSPDQQFDTVDETKTRLGYPWVRVATYRDDGVSGRYVRRRPGLQRLLRDIETGVLQIDLIAVDTLERLGRADEIAEIRCKLFVEHGVLVVAADNNFADPTGVVGKAVGLVEQIRSTEDTRIKAHNVLRGKKDTARRKRWPGGVAPFGYRLKAIVNESVVPPDFYNVLEHEPSEAAALALAFTRAAELGEGTQRLSQWWNTCPEIPDRFKPISATVMGYRLENPIAIGTLRWGWFRTGVVSDTRVVEVNADGAELVPDFCESIVSVELYERVQSLRRARGDRIRLLRQQKLAAADGAPAKLIAPQSRGLTLKYILSGLVRCGTCNSSMHATPSGRLSQAGRRYVYYSCPRHYDGSCTNGRHVPEDRLRSAVLARLRERLFPAPNESGPAPMWLSELLEAVRHEWQRCEEDEPNRLAVANDELAHLERQLAGWSMSLGNPQLPPEVRTDVEAHYAEGKRRQKVLQQAMDARQARLGHVNRILDDEAVLAELQHLDEVLGAHNPTLVNLELSKHIAVIVCQADGRVEMRGTYLGLFAGAADLLGRQPEPAPAKQAHDTAAQRGTVRPRRRGRLRLPSLSAAGQDALGDAETSLDPERFDGLPQSMVWTEAITLPQTMSWAQAHADAVGRKRAEGLTMDALAKHFGKSVPTILKAWRYAIAADPSLHALPAKMPQRRWEEDHANEVASLRAEGQTIKQLASHFGKSEPTISKALKFAARHSSPTAVSNPDQAGQDS